MNIRKKHNWLVFLLGVIIVGCGQKGALYEPPPAEPNKQQEQEKSK